METQRNRLTVLVAAALMFSAAQRPCVADSAAWKQNPTNGDWNTAANWTPKTVPNSTSDVATFGGSNVTALSITNTSIDLDSAIFSGGAPPYTTTIQISDLGFYSLTLNGAGIVNNSGVMQLFVISDQTVSFVTISFYNSASAGEMTTYTSATGGNFTFYNSSSAGSATFNLTGGVLGGTNIDFEEGTTAANATINLSGGAYLIFYNASGGNATFNLAPGSSYLQFGGDSSADHAIVNSASANGVLFLNTASADKGIFTTIGGSMSGESGSSVYFGNSATAGTATFVINGGRGAGLSGTLLIFSDTATAANANIIGKAGLDGSDGGVIVLKRLSKGAKASITLQGNSELDISKHRGSGGTIGSLSGNGLVLLGDNTLIIGSNNQSTTFSGVIQDSGGVTKKGMGALTLSGANLYTGLTTVKAGVLLANNRHGSATGSGSVQVQAGTLGGKGLITGPVTIGSGSGSGASLAPSVASKQPVTLSFKSTLTFKADSTCSYTLRAKQRKSQSDQVIAKGVTIESGAQFNFLGQVRGKLRQGTSFSLISNTASTPISGTFANLPDGAILSVSGNNLQASYSGGDGNDLTLTVVP